MTIRQPCHPVGAVLPTWPHSGMAPAGRALTCYLLPAMRDLFADCLTAAGLSAGLIGGAVALCSAIALATPCADLGSAHCNGRARAELAGLMGGLSVAATGGVILAGADVARCGRRRA